MFPADEGKRTAEEEEERSQEGKVKSCSNLGILLWGDQGEGEG